MYVKIILVLLVSWTTLCAIDQDLDGVDDSVDRCLNTSFDDLVDEHGCPYQKAHSNSKMTLEIGSEVAYDTEDIRTSSISFYASYHYHQWFVSLSNRSYSIDNSSYDSLSLAGDYYLMAGYTASFESFVVQHALGMKLPNDSSDISTGENDYFAFLTFAYPLSNKLSLKGSYGYTLTGDSDTQEYSNYHTLMLSTHYQYSEKMQLGIGYKYSGSSYGEDYHTLVLKGCYRLSDNFYLRMGYERGLNDEAYQNSFSLSIGVNFE